MYLSSYNNYNKDIMVQNLNPIVHISDNNIPWSILSIYHINLFKHNCLNVGEAWYIVTRILDVDSEFYHIYDFLHLI